MFQKQQIIIVIPSAIEMRNAASVLPGAEKFKEFYLKGYKTELNNNEIILIEIGVGGAKAVGNLEIVLKKFLPDKMILFGACGSLSPKINVGEFLRIKSIGALYGYEEKIGTESEIIASHPIIEIPQIKFIADEKSGAADNYLKCPEVHGVSLNKMINSKPVQEMLFKKFDFKVVDFETYAVAEFLIRQKIPFDVYRVVTDNACEDALQQFYQTIAQVLPEGFKILISKIK